MAQCKIFFVSRVLGIKHRPRARKGCFGLPWKLSKAKLFRLSLGHGGSKPQVEEVGFKVERHVPFRPRSTFFGVMAR